MSTTCRVTQEFLERHPGGPEIILANANKDVTRLFKPIHPPGTLQEQEGQPAGITKVGRVPTLESGETELSDEDRRIQKARQDMPHIDEMINLDDFEKVCRKILAKKAWACAYRPCVRPRDAHWTLTQTLDLRRLLVRIGR